MSKSYFCYLIIFLATLPMLNPGKGWAAGKTTRVSVDSSKNQGDDESGFPAISAEGRFIAFESDASNLVEGDTNGVADVFIRNQKTKKTLRVSIDSNGNQGNDSSHMPVISADGRFVAFESYASNLVEGDTNGASNIFVHDRKTGETTRVSMGSQGNQSNGHSTVPALSADGRFVAFESHASNLLVEGDTNGVSDVFVHDHKTGETTRVSVSSEGEEGDYASYAPSLSADGRYVAFESYASNLVTAVDINYGAADIFVHDRQTGETTRVSVDSEGAQGGYSSYTPAISADGLLVAFKSLAANLVDGDTNNLVDSFVHDRQTGKTERVSMDSDGIQGNGSSKAPVLSADGHFVAFASYASNLVVGDDNRGWDVFLHNLWTGKALRTTVDSAGNQSNGMSVQSRSVS